MSTPDNDSSEVKYKTKDYVRRAINKYKKKKYAEDEEFRKKQSISSKKSYEKNKDKHKEKRKLYMREYRARKKKVQSSNQQKELSGKKDIKNIDNKQTEKVNYANIIINKISNIELVD